MRYEIPLLTKTGQTLAKLYRKGVFQNIYRVSGTLMRFQSFMWNLQLLDPYNIVFEPLVWSFNRRTFMWDLYLHLCMELVCDTLSTPTFLGACNLYEPKNKKCQDDKKTKTKKKHPKNTPKNTQKKQKKTRQSNHQTQPLPRDRPGSLSLLSLERPPRDRS